METTVRDKVSALLARAIAAEEVGDLITARRCYEQSVAVGDTASPGEPEEDVGDLPVSWLRYASLLEDLKEFANAIGAASRALDYRSCRRAAYTIIGRCQQELKDYPEAESAYRSALAIREDPSVLVLLFFLLACCVDDREEEAVAYLHRALEIDAGYEEAHYNLGCHHYRRDEFDQARDCFQRAIELDPQYGRAHWGFGWMLVESQEQPDHETLRLAEHHLQQAVRLEPGFVWAHIDLGNVSARLGKKRAALAAYRGAVKTAPEFATAHLMYGDFLADSGNRNLAEQHLRRATELEPDDADCHFFLGFHLLRWERHAQAWPRLRRAADLGSSSAQRLLSARAEGGPRANDLMLKWPDVSRASHVGLAFGRKHKT